MSRCLKIGAGSIGQELDTGGGFCIDPCSFGPWLGRAYPCYNCRSVLWDKPFWDLGPRTALTQLTHWV